ncbi:MAG TPA: hypothetical protein VEU62_09850, partial [Bryobacterales bacterium]|nr:hypothetical protein [Bryobacterales bacterium]
KVGRQDMYDTSLPGATRQNSGTLLFSPHPHLSDEINRNIIESEIEGGVLLDRLPIGAVLEVTTQNRFYRLEHLGDGRALIAGHPVFCPEAVLVDVHGSTWGGSLIKIRFVGRGMRLEFHHPLHGLILTSRIQEIRELTAAAPSSSAGGSEAPYPLQ